MIYKHIRSVTAFLVACVTISCTTGSDNKVTKVSQIVMGTLVEISAVGPPDRTKPAIDSAFNEMRRIEDLCSFQKPSGLSGLNGVSGKGQATGDTELVDLIVKSLDFSRLSDGAFDPTIGPVSQLWNFSGAGSPRLPERSEIEQTLPLVGWRLAQADVKKSSVSLQKEGMALDLGAIAKGYAADKAAEKLKDAGVKAALVNAGGNIVAYGSKEKDKPWRIGIQDPRNPTGIIATGEITDRGIATSGDYERFFIQDSKRYHHLLDPKTGYPADELQSVTILANDGMTADALSTAVFVLGKEKGLALVESLPDVAALMVDAEGKVTMSQRAGGFFHLR